MIGKTISHYKILEKLGEGGMGVVYKAEDTDLKRIVALKFLPQALGGDEEKERFLREAQAAAALDHPNICTIYEVNPSKNKPFIAMAYVDGPSLRQKVQERPLELGEAVDIAIQVAEGLNEAHERGIVHRDMKSENVMLTAKGQAKIMDFGLAKRGGQSQLTKEGTSVGTVSYMSPEQSRGEEVDQRSDIWSFGVMLYEMISGQLPFKGDYDQAVIYSIMNEDPAPLTGLRTGVPLELERITGKAMAKNQDERYRRMDDLLIDLRVVAKGLESGASASQASGSASSMANAGGASSVPGTETALGVLAPADTAGPSSSSAQPAQPESSLVRVLLQKRVPQILAIYLVFSFGLVQLVGWLAQNYPISPNLPDFVLILLLAMIPTVLLLAFFHGEPGRNPWTRMEKLGIPVNVLAAAALLFVIFQGRDLGAATQTVSVTDESGQTIERIIPKSEFHKRLAIFYFDNETGDSTYDWLQYGLPELLSLDLEQEQYLNIGTHYADEMKEAGFAAGVGVPLTLKKRTADSIHRPYFFTGFFTNEGDNFTLVTQLYESKNVRLIAEREFSSPDIFELADLASLELKRDLEIPDYHLEQSTDLPVKDMMTSSVLALELYCRAYYERHFADDFEKAAQLVEKAVTHDPSFSIAYVELHGLYQLLNKHKEAERAISSAIQHQYKLPETYRFVAKNYYYRSKDEDQQRLDNATNWVKLYPASTNGHHGLADAYRKLGRFEEAIQAHQTIYELDPGAALELQHIGGIYAGWMGKYEEALPYFQQYADQFPSEVRAFNRLGDTYRNMGDFVNAKANYNKALLIEPEEIQILMDLARVDIQLGNFDEAFAQFQSALTIVRTPQDSSEVLTDIASYYGYRGQVSKAGEALELALALQRKFMSPRAIMVFRFNSTMFLTPKVGREKEALDLLAEIKPSRPPGDAMVLFGYVIVYDAVEDADKLEEAVNDLEASAAGEQQRSYIDFYRGRTLALQGHHSQAIEYYQKAMDASQFGLESGSYHMGVSYRMLGELDRAEEIILDNLKLQPMEPEVHYELALVYWDMGRKVKAREHLDKALLVWEEADPEFKPAIKARAKLAEWGE